MFPNGYEMRIKEKKLGAGQQLSEPEIGRLAAVMDRLLAQKQSCKIRRSCKYE